MSREVRRVPADWDHPRDESGRYIPILGDEMPPWSDAEKTHYMMYEATSEGTPISPACATKEELAHWLADNGASAFGRMTATYEEWLATIEIGWAPSAVRCICPNGVGVIRSGVEASLDVMRNDQPITREESCSSNQ